MHVSRLESQIRDVVTGLQVHDGTCVMRIANIREIMRCDKAVTVTSPPFYTGRNGYKMCVRAHFNGDRDYLTLYFEILQGEYDALLEWPFKNKVSFTLIDQTRSPIVRTFNPCIGKLDTDMNIASGCPRFASGFPRLDIKECYGENDTMFIKCIVDPTRS